MKKLLTILICFFIMLPLKQVNADPSTTNRTMWIKGDSTTNVTTNFNPCSTAVTDGNAVVCWDNEDAGDNSFLFTSDEPTFESTGINSLGTLIFDGTDDGMLASNEAGGTGRTIDTFFAADAYTAFAVVKITGDCSNNSNSYDEDSVFSDTGGYLALWCETNAGTTKLGVYNWDGNEDNASVTISQNTDYVVMIKHTGGSIYININNGALTANTTSGNTEVITGTIKLGIAGSSSGKIPMQIGEVVFYDIDVTGTDLTNNWAYLRCKWQNAECPSTGTPPTIKIVLPAEHKVILPKESKMIIK